ncbi:nuclear transport factor 2 family protein [Haliangium ochraceum]|uniref:eIF2Aa initiation factor n=1 Tax=Haliangium ochraceum (strain DSM 14365 / JCM 11303 / SMP-2) TaxID=502025 RepID=D0LTP7_HALO1|nr:nuclear transport factor 2 family protein [Haliangium ochraceum]ACY15741.1 EIF2Aa; initiation factor [Haliangium ochraceum DSM 14365]
MSRAAIARAQVEAINQAFYRAFEQCDIEQMDQIWSHGAHVRCVHPGWEMLEGWSAVRSSWVMIFEETSSVQLAIDQVSVRACERMAWVTCMERVTTPSAMGALENEALATNVFERADEDGSWVLVQHHASPILREFDVIDDPIPRPDELN